MREIVWVLMRPPSLSYSLRKNASILKLIAAYCNFLNAFSIHQQVMYNFTCVLVNVPELVFTFSFAEQLRNEARQTLSQVHGQTVVVFYSQSILLKRKENGKEKNVKWKVQWRGARAIEEASMANFCFHWLLFTRICPLAMLFATEFVFIFIFIFYGLSVSFFFRLQFYLHKRGFVFGCGFMGIWLKANNYQCSS